MIINIDSYSHDGLGIGHINGKVVFVPNTIIGEEVEIEIVNDKNNYSLGKVINFINKSPNRVKSICPYYNKCGGCSYQHLNIEDERKLRIKEKESWKKY